MLMGLGNGAVFKLVPEHFPKDTGTVTGLVGALGGLGGFFPPLLLGVFRDQPGRRSGPDSFCSRRRRWCCASRTSGCSVRATSSGRVSLPIAARQALERVQGGCVGDTRRGAPRRGHRRWIAQPPAFRRGAGRLHLRDAVCGVRDQLPLRDVAEPSADAHVLATWMAGVLLASNAWPQHGQPRPPRDRGVRRECLHLPARPAARASRTG